MRLYLGTTCNRGDYIYLHGETISRNKARRLGREQTEKGLTIRFHMDMKKSNAKRDNIVTFE